MTNQEKRYQYISKALKALDYEIAVAIRMASEEAQPQNFVENVKALEKQVLALFPMLREIREVPVNYICRQCGLPTSIIGNPDQKLWLCPECYKAHTAAVVERFIKTVGQE